MQRPWLGDALDFWKGTLLDVMRKSSTPSRPVKVLPMFTDGGWTPAEVDTYAAILGVQASALLATSQLTNPVRSSYFAVCAGLSDDVFADPDIGLAIGNPQPSHVTHAEIFAMLSEDNVVAVYQHRPQRVAAGWLTRYAQLLTATGAVTIGYESAQVGMLFATKSSRREAAIRGTLAVRLGAVAFARGGHPGPPAVSRRVAPGSRYTLAQDIGSSPASATRASLERPSPAGFARCSCAFCPRP